MNARKMTNDPDKRKAQELPKTLSLCAKEKPARRFHALYDKIYCPYILWKAWQRVKKKKGNRGGLILYVLSHFPKRDAMKKMRAKIKAYTEPRGKLFLDIDELIKGLNRRLQGFKNYYGISSKAKEWLRRTDSYMLKRLVLSQNKKKKQTQETRKSDRKKRRSKSHTDEVGWFRIP